MQQVGKKEFEKKVNTSADSDREMDPQAVFERESDFKAMRRLENKVAIITGGDSGIGNGGNVLNT